MGLNERQIKAVMYVKETGRITNKEYQKICGAMTVMFDGKEQTLAQMSKIFHANQSAGAGSSLAGCIQPSVTG